MSIQAEPNDGLRQTPYKASETPRERCYACYRPRQECYCESIPRIDNQTEVLILQHTRERYHPFNTARMVHQALQNSALLFDFTPQLAAAKLPLKPGAGLLYPSPHAKLLSDLKPAERPTQLVVLDGTWHHAKTLQRDVKALHDLPCYQLSPPEPGEYRIRREPSATTLSTVEATVAALRDLEPETQGWDELLAVFQQMVGKQLSHSQARYDQAVRPRAKQAQRNVPRVILDQLQNVVIAYGEVVSQTGHIKRPDAWPVYWVAERLVSGERFACTIEPAVPPTADLLEHWELTHADFQAAFSPAEASAAWTEFLQPQDTVLVYNQGTANLHNQICVNTVPCLTLKGVQANFQERYQTLDQLVQQEQLPVSSPTHPGRAGRRLANLGALVNHLHRVGTRT